MNEIRLVRLTSGEELLCKKLNETGLTITIKQAVALVPTKERLKIMPYLPYEEQNTWIIKKEKIICDIKTTKEYK